MPSYTLKCKECNYTDDYIVQITKGIEDKHYCPKCFMKLKSVVLERDFNPSKVNLIIKSDRHKTIEEKHADDKKIKSDFEQHANDILDENQKIQDTEIIVDNIIEDDDV